MLKKLFFILFATLFILLFKQNLTQAKEYCHLYENETFIDTIELPFYFYETSMTTEIINAWPQITYESTYQKIDSLTKCDKIKKAISSFSEKNTTTSFVYDYSLKLYTSYTNQQIYEMSKLSNLNSTIKGYSSILDEEPPTIEGYKDYYKTNIDNPLPLSIIISNITAYDNRDGNITDKIEVSYSEYENNINKLGTYPTILSVEDSASNKTSITFYIEIIDTTSPTITGTQNYISYLSSQLTIEEIKNNLIATDNVDTNLTSQIYACEDTYSINKSKPGTYDIYFCVYDSSSNLSSPYKTSIQVKDDIPPIIEGLDHYISYLSNPLSIQVIMQSLAACDNEQDITNSIFITNDNYSNYLNTLGEKSITVQAIDNSNNLSEPFKITIELKDDIKPQIFGLDTYISNLSSPLSLTYLKQQLTVLDNFDGNISNNLEIISDTYTSNINKLGTYYLYFQAKDYSNNISETFKISISTKDDVSPTIEGPSTLKYSLDNKPSLENLLSEYKVNDNIDEKLTIDIETDTYSTSFTTGTYYVTISSTDSSNNKSSPFIIKINVVEILLNLNELSLSLPTSKIYTIEEINKIINLNETYTILENTYTPNYSIEGNYTIEYKLEDNSKIILTINTYSLKQQESKKSTIKKETFFSKIKSFFLNLFIKIKLFFKNLINLNIYSKY